MLKSFDIQRKIWFNFIRSLSFLSNEKALKLQNFIKAFFGLTDKNSIKLEICSLCNVRCAWCWMYYNSVNKPKGIMKYENFKKFINLNSFYFLKKKVRIIPYFNGESLLHPQILQILEDIENNKISMAGLHSNLSINIDIERLMSFSIPRFVVNIGGITKEVHEKVILGSNFGLVTSNLKRMIAINKNIVFVKINPTKYNVHQLKDLKKFIMELGGYPQNTIISTTGLSLPFLASREEKEEFFSKVVNEEVSKYLRFTYKRDEGEIVIESKDRIDTCQFLTDCVAFDGRLTICCHDQIGKINLGNAFETSIEELKKTNKYKEIYNKAKLKSFDFCRTCN
jgi:pyruvate-formate lyase-activating enzyme